MSDVGAVSVAVRVEVVTRVQAPWVHSGAKIYRTIDELQADLGSWLVYYNTQRSHQGKMCCGRTPRQTLIDGKAAWNSKIAALND